MFLVGEPAKIKIHNHILTHLYYGVKVAVHKCLPPGLEQFGI